MKSMTGYGRATVEVEALQMVLEASSVNRKNFDLAISLPREWQRLEVELAELVRARVQRGRVNLTVTLETPGESGSENFNRKAVEVALQELKGISQSLEVPFEPDARLLFQIAAATRGKTVLPEAETVSSALLTATGNALSEMVAMRGREGEALRTDLRARREFLLSVLGQIREASDGVVPNYREILLKRLRQSGLDFTLEDERVLKEIAIFADRCDISEELVRLESHLGQFQEFLEVEEPIGRKIEFLLQEVGREFNTIGSKAADKVISRLVIDGKNEIERIREQVQNVE